MPAGTLIRNAQVALERAPRIVEPEEERRLRPLALERIYRLRRFKLHAAAFALGLPILGASGC